MKTTLLVLVLNEIESIPLTLPKIRVDWVDEIIVVDGGSTDGTIEWCKAHGYTVLQQEKPGYGQGVREAARVAKGDILIEYMPDGNCDASAIPRLIQKINEGYDLVVASRYLDGSKSLDDTWYTRFGNWSFTKLVNLLFRASYTDALMGYRAYRKEVFTKLPLDTNHLCFPTQGSVQFVKYGFRVAEIGSSEPKRLGGKRKVNYFTTGLELLYMIIREFFR